MNRKSMNAESVVLNEIDNGAILPPATIISLPPS